MGRLSREKKKNSEHSVHWRRIWLITVFVVIFAIIANFRFLSNTVEYHFNHAKWHIVQNNYSEDVSLARSTCYWGMNSFENSETCLLDLWVVDIERGFNETQQCIAFRACDVLYDTETGTPIRVHNLHTNEILYFTVEENARIYIELENK